MSDPIVSLIRRFLPVSSRVGALHWLGDTPIGPAERWPELEEHHRVLILAEPGAGKTFEARSHATRMRERQQQAFFIRIEAIDADFPRAFEVGNAEEFASWLESNDDGWFFLDSVDEAQLETPRALETAIKLFGSRIYDARERTHIYITSREDAWQALPDRTLIAQYLPFGAPPEKSEEQEAEADRNEDPNLQVYRLAPLAKNEIQLFAGYHSVSDPAALLEAIERGNLWSLAERPFDLRALIGKWKADHVLGGRAEMLRRLARLQLDTLTGANARDLITSGRASEAVRTLATAVTMTGRNRLGLQGSTAGSDRIDPATLLPDWKPDQIDALLKTGIFDDIVYGSVRFRHRDMRELLTAEYLNTRMEIPAQRASIEALFFRDSYGEQVIVPRLRPVLVWLLLLDERLRDRALELEPEIATEGGDPSELPLPVRQKIIADVVSRIAARQQTGSLIDNVAIARVAQADLSCEVATLIDRHHDDDDVIFFLGRLVWQAQFEGCVARLLEIAVDANRGIYARIVSSRAVMTVGTAEHRAALWAAVVEEKTPLDRRLLAELVSEAAADEATVGLVLKAVEILQPYERFQASGLSSALHEFIDRLPMMADAAGSQPLAAFVEGINRLLDREPHVERGECHVSEDYLWLSGHGLHAVERLISSRSAAAFSAASIAVLLKHPALKYWRSSDAPEYKNKLRQLIPRWADLNDALYWSSVAERRHHATDQGERVVDDRRIAFIGHFWSFGKDAFERVLGWVKSRHENDDALVALSRAVILYFENEQPATWLEQLRSAVAGNSAFEDALESQINPVPSEQTLKWDTEHSEWERKQREREETQEAERADWVRRLRDDPNRVRQPQGLEPGQFSTDQYNLMVSIEGEGLSTSRGRGANWKGLIPEFGEEVALAYRDAAVKHWRHFRPGLGSEGASRSSIPYSLLFAMVGLQIETEEDPALFTRLTDEEALLALRYALYELNGFPLWFEPLYRARPALARAFVWGEMQWELETSRADEPMHYIVHDVVYHAPWLHSVVAPPLLSWLESHEAPSLDTQRYALTILMGGATAPELLDRLATLKLESRSTPAAQRPVWFATLVGANAAKGIPLLEAELDGLVPTDASDFAQSFVVALLGGRRAMGTSLESFRNARQLKELYVLMHRHIRLAEDIERAGKGVYSPTQRDDAQEARNRLFGLLSEAPGLETYRAIKELENDHPEEDYRRWMKLRAHERAVTDADEPLWLPKQAETFLTSAHHAAAEDGSGKEIAAASASLAERSYRRCFVSGTDHAATDRLLAMVRARGIEAVSTRELRPGQEITKEIVRIVGEADFIAVVMSAHPAASVAYELGLAQGLGKPAFVVFTADPSLALENAYMIAVDGEGALDGIGADLDRFIRNAKRPSPRQLTSADRAPQTLDWARDELQALRASKGQDRYLTFERLCAKILRSAGFEVTEVGDDQSIGADLVVWLNDVAYELGGSTLVECKFYGGGVGSVIKNAEATVRRIESIINQSDAKLALLVYDHDRAKSPPSMFETPRVLSFAIEDLIAAIERGTLESTILKRRERALFKARTQ